MSDIKASGHASHRWSLYKLGSPSASLRKLYKERCTEHLKTRRSKMYNRFRNLQCDDVQEVMQQEWTRIKSEPFSCEVNFDDVLKTMEEIKFELLQWEKETLLDYEHATFNNSIAQGESTENDLSVVCPLCNSNYINIHLGNLRCNCGLMMNTGQESIDLPYVKKCLEEGVSNHSVNCVARPVFSIVSQLSATNLLLTCNNCDYMFVVL